MRFVNRSERGASQPAHVAVKSIAMNTPPASSLLALDIAKEDRRAALGYVNEAFAEAILAGLEMESFADAAIAAGLQELIACYGEEAVISFTAQLPDRVRRGEFTTSARH